MDHVSFGARAQAAREKVQQVEATGAPFLSRLWLPSTLRFGGRGVVCCGARSASTYPVRHGCMEEGNKERQWIVLSEVRLLPKAGIIQRRRREITRDLAVAIRGSLNSIAANPHSVGRLIPHRVFFSRKTTFVMGYFDCYGGRVGELCRSSHELQRG